MHVLPTVDDIAEINSGGSGHPMIAFPLDLIPELVAMVIAYTASHQSIFSAHTAVQPTLPCTQTGWIKRTAADLLFPGLSCPTGTNPSYCLNSGCSAESIKTKTESKHFDTHQKYMHQLGIILHLILTYFVKTHLTYHPKWWVSVRVLSSLTAWNDPERIHTILLIKKLRLSGLFIGRFLESTDQ